MWEGLIGQSFHPKRWAVMRSLSVIKVVVIIIIFFPRNNRWTYSREQFSSDTWTYVTQFFAKHPGSKASRMLMWILPSIMSVWFTSFSICQQLLHCLCKHLFKTEILSLVGWSGFGCEFEKLVGVWLVLALISKSL